jgi:hypothetical protein
MALQVGIWMNANHGWKIDKYLHIPPIKQRISRVDVTTTRPFDLFEQETIEIMEAQ